MLSALPLCRVFLGDSNRHGITSRPIGDQQRAPVGVLRREAVPGFVWRRKSSLVLCVNSFSVTLSGTCEKVLGFLWV